MSKNRNKIQKSLNIQSRSFLKSWTTLFSILAILVVIGITKHLVKLAERHREIEKAQAKTKVADVLGKRSPLPGHETINGMDVEYSLSPDLQDLSERLLKTGKIHYGAIVTMDPTTGQILSMASHGIKSENLTLRATFPSASIFKIITAAAAVETGRLTNDSLIPVRGSFHTLYKANVLKSGGINPDDTLRKYTRLISLRDALAKSVNSVFGKVGIFGVGRDGLRKVASDFMFDRHIPFEMPVDQSIATIPNDDFGIAESASGYTRLNTMSPVHGALIGAAIVNDGKLMEPSIVSKITDQRGEVWYESEPRTIGQIIQPRTAEELKEMMHQTIISGTSRRAFRNTRRSLSINNVFVGGKTGTLNGNNPPGRYDWFVGFGEKDGKKISVSVLCIHGLLHGIKASQMARQLFEAYFGTAVFTQHKVKIKRRHS